MPMCKRGAPRECFYCGECEENDEIIDDCAFCGEPVYVSECNGGRRFAPLDIHGDIVHADCVEEYIEEFRMLE